MEMSGSVKIEAPRQAVWEALNDPEVLKACIPGCETLDKTEDNAFSAAVKAKVGPISAKFKGDVVLSDINPPESYTISGEGKGGAAGFAKGGAKVHLTEEADGTLLSYDVNAKVGGKMAQLGSRLIDGTAKKMAEDFFAAFAAEVVGRTAALEAAQEPTPAETTPPEEQVAQATSGSEDEIQAQATDAAVEAVQQSKQRKALNPFVWISGLVVILGILLYLSR